MREAIWQVAPHRIVHRTLQAPVTSRWNDQASESWSIVYLATTARFGPPKSLSTAKFMPITNISVKTESRLNPRTWSRRHTEAHPLFDARPLCPDAAGSGIQMVGFVHTYDGPNLGDIDCQVRFSKTRANSIWDALLPSSPVQLIVEPEIWRLSPWESKACPFNGKLSSVLLRCWSRW